MNYLDPNISYISVSKDAGERFREITGSYGDNFDDIRKVIISASHDAEEVQSFKNLNVLLKVFLHNVNKTVYLLCVVNEGSPAGNKSITTIVRKVLSSEQFQKLYQVNRGFTPLGLPVTDGISDDDMDFIERWIHRLRAQYKKENRDKEQQHQHSTQYRILTTLFDAIKYEKAKLPLDTGDGME